MTPTNKGTPPDLPPPSPPPLARPEEQPRVPLDGNGTDSFARGGEEGGAGVGRWWSPSSTFEFATLMLLRIIEDRRDESDASRTHASVYYLPIYLL